MSQWDMGERKPKVDTPQQRKLIKAATWIHDKTVGCFLWIKNRGLFGSIFTWASLAVVLLVVVILGLIWINHGWFDSEKVNVGTIVTPALGIVGGVGAVAYLVIAYRKQNNAEAAIIDRRMVTAIEQLASESPQKRMAGVYALAEISDTYKGEYRQRVVDILCGYLRTDRHGKYTQEIIDYVENRVSKSGKSDNEDASPNTESNQRKIVSPDAPVESTIFRVMRERLLKNRSDLGKEYTNIQTKETDQLWCDCSFDFHGAVFVEKIDLSKASCDDDLTFDNAYFLKYVELSDVISKSNPRFVGARFVEVSFDNARFDNARFDNARFDNARFDNARFVEVSFDNARFVEVSFDKARFVEVSFDNARFVEVSFVGACFDNARFDGASFDNARFDGASFGWARFVGACFDGASFDFARFDFARFIGARFVGARFDKASFYGAMFVKACFDKASFDVASFDTTIFDNACFVGASFVGARFDGVRFVGAHFGRTSFEKARFKNSPIGEFALDEEPYLDKIIFESGEIPESFAQYMDEDEKDYATNPARWPEEKD